METEKFFNNKIIFNFLDDDNTDPDKTIFWVKGVSAL